MKRYLIALTWFVLAWIAVGAAPPSRAGVAELGAAPANAAFEAIQSACVTTGKSTSAALARSACHVTKGRWFSTIEHDDFYQAQYCLHDPANAATCRQRALLVFVNRAYTPDARLTLERIDAAGTEYEDPQVIVTPYGYVLVLSATRAGGAPQKSYYLWQQAQWQPIDTESWAAGLARQLPPGSRPGALPAVDFETLQGRLDVFTEGDAACCPGRVAEIRFELVGPRLAIAALRTVAP